MLARLKSRIWTDVVLPNIVRRGFRQAQGAPLDDAHLSISFGFDDEPAIKKAADKVRSNTMSSFERLASLWQQVKYLDRYGIPGSFVECGVWRGGSMGMMALAHQAAGRAPQRKLHLFDSFEGLPEPDTAVDGAKAVEYSKNQGGGKLKPIGMCVGPLEDNKELLAKRIKYPENLTHYHVGWFQDTLPKVAGSLGPIALLRLDGDWYESTKLCLEHLYSHVVKGGVVVIDDYGHWEGCRRAVDEFLAKLDEPVLLGHVDYSCRYWVRIGEPCSKG